MNAVKFIISPDVKYVLLLSDVVNEENTGAPADDWEAEVGARYHVFEVQARNQFPLSPKDGVQLAPMLQHVLWAPNPQSIKERQVQRQRHHGQQARERQQEERRSQNKEDKSKEAYVNSGGSGGGGALINNNNNNIKNNNNNDKDIVDRISPAKANHFNNSSNSNNSSVINVAGHGSGPAPLNGTPNNRSGPTTTMPGNGNQAIAFVHENDIYYKPKVQSDLVCRITTTGKTRNYSFMRQFPFP